MNLIHIFRMDSENKNSEFFLCIKKITNINTEVSPKIRFDKISINTDSNKIKKGLIFSWSIITQIYKTQKPKKLVNELIPKCFGMESKKISITDVTIGDILRRNSVVSSKKLLFIFIKIRVFFFKIIN